MSLLYTTLVYNQGHRLAFPIDPDYHWPLTSHITLVIQPLISDVAGVILTPLRLGESPKNIGAEFGSEGAESKEVFGLLSEEVDVRATLKCHGGYTVTQADTGENQREKSKVSLLPVSPYYTTLSCAWTHYLVRTDPIVRATLMVKPQLEISQRLGADKGQ